MRIKLLVLLLSFSFSLFLFESLLKISGLVPEVYSLSVKRKDSSYELSNNQILGYELKKNFKASEPNFHSSYPLTNSFGFRDKERTLKKSLNTNRIIFLGDSVTIGQGIKNINETIPLKVESILNDSALEKSLLEQGQSKSSSKNQYEVLNFGMSGYCTFGEIELLEKKGLKFKPDMVLVLFVENDFIGSNGAILNELGFTRPAWQEDLFKKSRLFRLLALSFNFFSFKDELGGEDLVLNNHKIIGENNVERGFARLKKLSKKHGFETLTIIWPSFDDKQIFYKDSQYTENQHSENKQLKVKKILKELDLNFLELKPAFEKHLAESSLKHKQKKISPNWSYTISDGMHPNKKGAAIAAKDIASKILSLKDS